LYRLYEVIAFVVVVAVVGGSVAVDVGID